ncbi:hypothetical protein [Micromonospora tulbaghiae]|uniref:hypothetical protein n=1 Tax=Micromonospora tulbaghiae TaxID=479978 RepID=UPI003EB70D8E
MTQTGPDHGAGRPAVDRVRVGKFDWERLMMVSPLPWPTRSILLTLAIYMDDDGGSARPGLPALVRLTRGRTVVIEHLQTAVDAGYLKVVERGGFRRATARATEYAATVPADVYERRDLILSSPPWRRDTSRTSGGPDLGADERPVGRTLAKPSTSGGADLDGSRRSGFDGRRSGFGPRTSGQPDPINHLTSTTQHQPQLLEAPEPPPRVDAAVVVAAFIDGAVGAGQDRPTSALIGKVGRDAKRLMGEGVSLDKLTAAATAMGRAGWSSLDTQLQRMSAERANNGQGRTNGHQTYRDPDRAAYYQGSL